MSATVTRPLNIALLGKGLLWGGGLDFLRTIATALLSDSHHGDVRIFLLLPEEYDRFHKKKISALLRCTHHRTGSPDPGITDSFAPLAGEIEIVRYQDAPTVLLAVLRRLNADVVLPVNGTLGKDFPIPWVGYLPDFQHKYLHDLFSAEECFNRDCHFATILRDARAVIVNAKSVAEDIRKFYPYNKSMVFNLPFSPAPVKAWLSDSTGIPASYRLPGRYFLISNQFWVHKSHMVAFRALKLLAEKNRSAEVHIICTGRTEDYRQPEYFQMLQQEIGHLGLEDRIHFLGHIPKADQIAIMKRSLAVLQPSLFEGGPGGGATYDAVSLGIPVIASDIPVNMEAEDAGVRFFSAGSAEDLAAKMYSIIDCAPERPSVETLLAMGAMRTGMLKKRLHEAIAHVTRS